MSYQKAQKNLERQESINEVRKYSLTLFLYMLSRVPILLVKVQSQVFAAMYSKSQAGSSCFLFQNYMDIFD